MGRIRYILFQFAKILPRGYRKPIYAVTSVLGLFIFLNFMTNMTQSPYLIEIQKAIYTLQNVFMDRGTMPLFLLFICLLVYWLSTKRYQEFKMIVSIGYLLIFVFSFLPLFLKV